MYNLVARNAIVCTSIAIWLNDNIDYILLLELDYGEHGPRTW